MFDPVSTYRIQFHRDFTFKDLAAIIPYIAELGIRTIYASPIFEAVPGSTHGYDVVNPLRINPEIGTIRELRTISKKLHGLGINWLQDIVPNHMAYHPNNNWLMDVLANGKRSEFASFFDIEWDSNIYEGRIMVPFLGVPFEDALAQQQIRLALDKGKVWQDYAGQRYPVNFDFPEPVTAAYLKKVNKDPALISEVCAAQAYQLCYWQETDRQINYRRFFTVNGLISLNMQHREVFDHYHQFIRQLIEEGVFQGLRVDHVDGLKDPKGYLANLRELAGPDVYITVEKILEKGERFPKDWPVQGNTGYDFLAIANNVFTSRSSEKRFTAAYKEFTGQKQELDKSIRIKKALILENHLAGELDNLYQLFCRSELVSPEEWSGQQDSLKEAIAQLLIYCPVYRFYGNSLPFSHEEADAVRSLLASIYADHPALKAALALLKRVFLDDTAQRDKKFQARALAFYQRCMQFTGPLMAKGVEDTLMYTNSRFIGHNEVGDAPASFGISRSEFHELMRERQSAWPLSANATATHDTKRGEDARARLNALTDLPVQWFDLVQHWRKINVDLKTDHAPDHNDEYFIYQTIAGNFPMPDSPVDDFLTRLQEYLVKALREGKVNSNWAEPNQAYEKAATDFVAALLSRESEFLLSFSSFHRTLADHGIINSIAQLLLKFTAPGIPDTYQGCELWDFSLVDPDNRREVDYKLRKALLTEVDSPAVNWDSLWETRYDGHLKLALTSKLLKLRSADPQLFAEGEYLPLTTTGTYKDHVLAFARQFAGRWQLTAVPLNLAAIATDGADPRHFDWQDTAVLLPAAAPQVWTSLLTVQKGFGSQLPAQELFAELPLALLSLTNPLDRSAGLLLHVTSLSSAFGSGDLGPQAYRFIDFLFSSGQRYWQMLPVNPVDKGAGFSPYSATSSMAGNTLLISPELLAEAGWLAKDELKTVKSPVANRADINAAVTHKNRMFDQAWQNFGSATAAEKLAFERFKSTEAYWLENFSLYQVLKHLKDEKPWYEWEDGLKFRKASALKKAAAELAEPLEREKWLQYQFSQQWRGLRTYAAKKGIKLFGDMPFYISYDSADVWANRQFFKLDKQGKVEGIAGVPPDYFSADGQLWGMPVYNWAAIKHAGYNWWVLRVRKNLEYFDLIRLDHFRAFAAYWEVPGGEQTAINGRWQPGPGKNFFETLSAQLGALPFVAEDLGEIDEQVYQLRDQFGLPGMKVLQFGFGKDLPFADHIPHNYTINSFSYTGTHDNNTLKGWFADELDQTGHDAITRYTGRQTTTQNACDVLIRLSFASVSKVAIVPLQDLLGLDGEHRMNVPSSATGNWTWQLTGNELTNELSLKLNGLTRMYGR